MEPFPGGGLRKDQVLIKRKRRDQAVAQRALSRSELSTKTCRPRGPAESGSRAWPGWEVQDKGWQ